MFKIVKTTDHPVVKTYMDIIRNACIETGLGCKTVAYKQKQDKKRDIIVTDSPLVSIYYIIAGYKHHITWFQGISPEESYIKNKSKFRYRILSLVEYIVLRRAQLLFFVSEKMKLFYEAKYNLKLDNKSYIMPCFNELSIYHDSFEIAKKFQKNKFIYIGSLSEWQCFNQTVELFSEIEKRSHSSVELHVLTSQKDKAIKILKENKIKNFYVDYKQPQDLHDYIKDMKYGFILRKNIDVNQVATPTKLSNYLANGIIPIYSECLDSFHRLNQQIQLGIPCNIEDGIARNAEIIIKHMEKDLKSKTVRDKCSLAFTSYYNKEKYVDEIMNKLSDLK